MAAKTPVTTTPTAGDTWDWRGYIAASRFALDRKFEASDVDADPLLISCARFYLSSELPEQISHAGIKQFVSDVAYKSKKYGLSSGQIKGVLNVAVGQVTAREGQEEAAAAFDGTQVIENGYFTIVLDGSDPEDTTAWVTLQVQDDFRENAPEGAQMISILTGPDNTRNYNGIGFLQGDRLMVWGKNKGKASWIEAAESLISLAKGDRYVRDGRERYAMESGRCSRCRKLLTVPKSVAFGIGPECRKQMGV
jgi:hypothetical protein